MGRLEARTAGVIIVAKVTDTGMGGTGSWRHTVRQQEGFRFKGHFRSSAHWIADGWDVGVQERGQSMLSA